MTTLSRILGVTLALALGAAAPALADDDDVTIDQVPAKVKATIQKHVADGKIEHIDRDRQRGEIVYEVDFEDRSGQDFELVIAEDGTLISKRKD